MSSCVCSIAHARGVRTYPNADPTPAPAAILIKEDEDAAAINILILAATTEEVDAAAAL